MNHSNRSTRRVAWALALLLPGVHDVRAGYLDDIGYTALAQELGDALPRGASVEVDQVEASLTSGASDRKAQGENDTGPRYRPDPKGSGEARFGAVEFADRSNGTRASYSGHATQIALLIAGKGAMTPGIMRIDTYESTNWITSVLYNHGMGYAPPRPQIDTGMLANHSWVGAPGAALAAADVLTRLDYLVDRPNYLQVVGAQGAQNVLLSQSYNAIAVVATSKPFAGLSRDLDDFYVAGRVVPWITAPAANTSSATAIVTSAVALLVDSMPSHTLPAPLVKALLAAGAEHHTHNGDGGDLDNWKDSAVNGLDPRYGAGQLDVRNAYHMLHAPNAAAGSRWEAAPERLPDDRILTRIDLPPSAHDATLHAALAWNARIDVADGPFVPVRSRARLELVLVTMDAAGQHDEKRVAGALGTSQHLTMPVARGARYRLEVRRDPADAAPQPGFAIAWRVASR